MIRGQKIFVAGGTGLVGANLTKRLHDLGAQVSASYYEKKPDSLEAAYRRYDLTQLKDCLAATEGQDAVFICAAQTFGAKIMKENPTALILPNLRINSGLLEACRINHVAKTVFISSSTVYQEAPYPIREDELDLNKPTHPLYMGVGWMKRYIEQLASFYVKRYGMKIAMVRPTNIYGPHDKFDDDKSHVLPALIKRALAKETPYVVWGTGDAVRDFLFVEDFVEDLIGVLEDCCTGEPVNVASGTAITIREAVGVILKVCGHQVVAVYDPSKPDAISYRMIDTKRFEGLFGKRTRTGFAAGIQKTVDWYKASLGARYKEPKISRCE